MSSIDLASAPATPSPGLLARWLQETTPLLALLRRDLLAGRRGTGTLVARTLAMLFAAAAVLFSFAAGVEGQRNEVAAIASVSLFVGLMLTGFLMGPAIAVSALRLEREAGMLDLLLLAGIRPGTLALGRMLSTWLFLLSLLFAALPGIAFLWFFRSPSPVELVLAAAALTSHFLALSGVVVAISAWARHAGYAIALSLVVFAAWIGAFFAGDIAQLPTSLALIGEAVGREISGPADPSFTPLEHVAGWTVNGLIGLLALGLATAGLRRRHPAAQRDILRERIDRHRAPARTGRVLTWLLQRRSAPARPAVQAALVIPACALALLGGIELMSVIGSLLIVAGILLALMLGATSIAPERERRAWSSLISTGLSGPAIFTDLLLAAALGSCVPIIAGILTCFAPMMLVAEDGARLATIGGMISVVITWLLALHCGLIASLVSRRTAGAISLGAAGLVGVPIVTLGGAAVAESVSSLPLDAGGILAWLALVFAGAFGGTWLVLRAGFKGWLRALLAFVPAIGVSCLPLFIGDMRELATLAPFVVLGGSGIPVLVAGLRRERGVMVYVGLLLVASCLVAPLTMMGMKSDSLPWAALSGLAWPVAAIDVSSGDLHPPLAGIITGIVFHASLAWTLGITFLPRLERWLGRAG